MIMAEVLEAPMNVSGMTTVQSPKEPVLDLLATKGEDGRMAEEDIDKDLSRPAGVIKDEHAMTDGRD